MDKYLHIYVRVSTQQQEEKGTSIESQIEMGKAIAKKLNLIPKIWNEGGKSSYRDDLSNRPKLKKLLAEIETSTIKNLWAISTDRIGRKNESWSYILSILFKHKISLYTENNTKPYNFHSPQDKMHLSLSSSFTNFDNDQRRNKCIIGKIKRLEEGNTYIGGTVPFGFKVKNKKLKIHPKESKVVQKVYEMYDKGHPVSEIKKYLDRQTNVKCRRSKLGWNHGTIQRMLRSRLYIGEQIWIWKDKETLDFYGIKNKHLVKVPQIIDEKLFNRVRKRVEIVMNKKNINKTLKHKSVLNGYLRCAECKLTLSHRYKNNNHYYGRCREYNYKAIKKLDIEHCAMKKSLLMEETNKVVYNTILDILSTSSNNKEKYKNDNLISILKNDDENKKKVESKKKYLREIRSSLSGYEEELIDIDFEIRTKKITKKEGDGLKKRYRELIDECKVKIESLKKEIKVLQKSKGWIDWLNMMEKDIDKMRFYDEDKQREVIQEFVDYIDVRYDTKKREHKLTIHFLIPILDDSIQYDGTKNKRRHKNYQIVNGSNQYNLSIKLNTSKKTSNKKREYLFNNHGFKGE